ncbi:acetolactate synthase large subunit [Oceanibaculum indicum]|uniref:Acetolactate synthase-1/2/3 large subunit n=1 Tax=Oceanibaculum indicum TaxID=526216 RepID=A0A420WGC7_9PROT|nr:acetolactate synthase large subunit [Oceanibaculum indicum]RKQ70048.1 acetolactate synthase-1/2/3 large subunit [Oceanibaculum indicum]
MNGAESLVRTLKAGGVDVCFTNPGTSEMHFVAALDRVDGVRCVLCLFEGVATGAADGYARMADKPASTLLHLGPGLGNGIANLHNAKKARSPMVNIVGEHATYHVQYDAPLTADIEGTAKPYSHWVKTSASAATIAADAADAIAAARTAPGQIATLIAPADATWEEGAGIAAVPAIPERAKADEAAIQAAAKALKSGEKVMILLGDKAVRAEALELAARIAEKTGAGLLAETSNARMERGQGRVAIERLPYPVDQAVAVLAEVKHLILIGSRNPVAFFAYPDKPSLIAPEGCNVIMVATPAEDQPEALARLADAVGATQKLVIPSRERPAIPNGALTPETIGAVVGTLLPENAIVCDEGVTTGRRFFPSTHASGPMDWLQLSGGAIGVGIPMATGAAVACPDRKVVSLQADGSAMYTVQGLWTQAREKLDVLTLIFSNRSYNILRGELANVGANNPGPKALNMLSLADPDIGWVNLARGLGVDATRVESAERLAEVMKSALRAKGPHLIEVVM